MADPKYFLPAALAAKLRPPAEAVADDVADDEVVVEDAALDVEVVDVVAVT